MSEAKVFTFDVDHQHNLTVEGRTPSQLSPHLQTSLRQSVLTKRHARGDGPIQLDDNKPKKYELREDEKEKRERRKKQNREAARRCRLKKKCGQTGTSQKLVGLKKNNDSLVGEVTKLRSEVQELQTILDEHNLSGTCVHQDQYHSECPAAGPDTGYDHYVPDYGQTVGPPTYTLQAGVQDGFQVPDPCYSPVSSCDSPYPEQQTTSWQLPDEDNRNIEGYYVSSSAVLAEPGFNQGLSAPYGVWATDTAVKTPPISGADMWLNQDRDADRATPEMIQDDHASMYPTSFPGAVIKPGPEVTTNGVMGIPSLDAIQLQELVSTTLVLPVFFPNEQSTIIDGSCHSL